MKFIIFGLTILFSIINPPAFADEISQSKSLEFSGYITNRYDKVYRRNDVGRLWLTDHFRSVFNLDIQAHPADQVDVYGKLGMTKYWNQWITQNRQTDGVYNFNTQTRFADSVIRVEEAYFNYKPFSWFTLTGGRLPTTHGSPVKYYAGKHFSGIYPKLAYGSDLDGAITTFHIAHALLADHHLDLRLAYVPYLLQNYNYQQTSTSTRPNTNSSASDAETLAPQAMASVHYEYKNLNLVAHYRWLNYLRFPDATISEASLNSGLSGTALTNSNIAVSLKMLTFHAEITDIAESRIDLSTSYLMSTLSSSGKATVTTGTLAGTDLGGYGTSKSDDTLNGGVLLVASRYHFLWEELKNPYLGIEFLTATKDSFYYDGFSEDPGRFYETRGNAYHVYILQPLNEALTVRVGYRRQDFSWTPIALGSTRDDRSKIETYYAHFKIDF
ncbi:MAG: DUF3373 family protein [Oligoflexia bacterium]|nr:DUF3373 family protein [Oligoflexia bacterium]